MVEREIEERRVGRTMWIVDAGMLLGVTHTDTGWWHCAWTVKMVSTEQRKSSLLVVIIFWFFSFGSYDTMQVILLLLLLEFCLIHTPRCSRSLVPQFNYNHGYLLKKKKKCHSFSFLFFPFFLLFLSFCCCYHWWLLTCYAMLISTVLLLVLLAAAAAPAGTMWWSCPLCLSLLFIFYLFLFFIFLFSFYGSDAFTPYCGGIPSHTLLLSLLPLQLLQRFFSYNNYCKRLVLLICISFFFSNYSHILKTAFHGTRKSVFFFHL